LTNRSRIAVTPAQVGVGGYLTSMQMHETAMWIPVLRRLPAGIAYAFGPSSEHVRYQGLRSKVTCPEKRSLAPGSAADALNCWRARRAAAAR
jgi:hypothetical protein